MGSTKIKLFYWLVTKYHSRRRRIWKSDSNSVFCFFNIIIEDFVEESNENPSLIYTVYS